jgi:hypothetical protein
MKNDKRFLELESELNEKKARLEGYEKCENEMDMVIRQVAETSIYYFYHMINFIYFYIIALIKVVKSMKQKQKNYYYHMVTDLI